MASPPGSPTVDFDVIVVGAGIAGCVTAYQLAKALSGGELRLTASRIDDRCPDHLNGSGSRHPGENHVMGLGPAQASGAIKWSLGKYVR